MAEITLVIIIKYIYSLKLNFIKELIFYKLKCHLYKC